MGKMRLSSIDSDFLYMYIFLFYCLKTIFYSLSMICKFSPLHMIISIIKQQAWYKHMIVDFYVQ